MLGKIIRALNVVLFSLVGCSLLLPAFGLLVVSLIGVIIDIFDGESGSTAS